MYEINIESVNKRKITKDLTIIKKKHHRNRISSYQIGDKKTLQNQKKILHTVPLVGNTIISKEKTGQLPDLINLNLF